MTHFYPLGPTSETSTTSREIKCSSLWGTQHIHAMPKPKWLLEKHGKLRCGHSESTLKFPLDNYAYRYTWGCNQPCLVSALVWRQGLTVSSWLAWNRWDPSAAATWVLRLQAHDSMPGFFLGSGQDAGPSSEWRRNPGFPCSTLILYHESGGLAFLQRGM